MEKTTKNRTSEKIKQSKHTKKEELQEEKNRLKKDKLHNHKVMKHFKNKTNNDKKPTLKKQVLSMIYFEIIGAVLCLLVLFVLSGGQNYIKLYKDLHKLIKVYDTIESNYYGELDKDVLVDAAIDSMINSIGDDYTTYTDSKTNNSILEDLEGTYEGIGCMIAMTIDGEIIVASVFEKSPAEKAGLQPEDIIIAIDGQDFKDKTSEDMSNYVKNSKKQQITLTIKRDNEEKTITINREKVEIPSVSSKIIEQDNKKIGYIDISIFSAVTYSQFKTHLENLEEQEIKGLIIDVRSDTGGYLSSVTDISNLLLKKGKVIYQLENSKSREKIKDKTKEHRNYPIAVLINGASASASEILASAIKESYGGIVIGTNSFGKGTVQKTQILSDGSMIKYTAQKWLTPKGTWINDVGVEPTIKVELDIKNNTDNQLEIAVSEILKQLN